MDAMGKQISTIVDDQMPGGFYEAEWSGLDRGGNRVASGLYIYRMSIYQKWQIQVLYS